MSGMKMEYKCPLCKEGTDNDPTRVVHYGKKRNKNRGGKYEDFYLGICFHCGIVYTYKTIESNVFEDEGK